MEGEEHPIVVLNGEKARKRSVNLKKRERDKALRYKQKCPPVIPNCNHRKEKSVYQCCSIKGKDAMQFSKEFYSSHNKIAQDHFILKYCSGVIPVRKLDSSYKNKSVSIEYFVRKCNKNIVKVCQKPFFGILGIGKDRVIRLTKIHLETGQGPTENRGGDRVSSKNEPKKLAVINFIKQFKTIEIHYCRNKSAKKQYLPSELNINKMYKLFIEAYPELNVKLCFFRNIFNRNFNIGFKMPSSDLCSKCIMLSEQIKVTTDQKKKQNLMVERVVHKRRAKAFFNLLKEERDDLLTISFDCQKNMVLPKLADQAAYYSRQFYMYNFGVVIGSSKSSLTKSNVYLYPWTEDRYPKGSNQIASAVNHCLRNIDFSSKRYVRLVADGCGGQNKNSIMIGMCAYWLLKESPQNITTMELNFPVPGHSYIPPDRVFARIEKELKNRETIIKPDEYMAVYKSVATVYNLGDSDCLVKDWKSEANKVLRSPGSWHFKFNECKRFILTKCRSDTILVRGEVAYKSDIGVAKPITKKGKKISSINPGIIEPGVQLAEAKIKDVANLLSKHFGNEWDSMENLTFYKNVMESNINNSPVDVDSICEAYDAHEGMRI